MSTIEQKKMINPIRTVNKVHQFIKQNNTRNRYTCQNFRKVIFLHGTKNENSWNEESNRNKTMHTKHLGRMHDKNRNSQGSINTL